MVQFRHVKYDSFIESYKKAREAVRKYKAENLAICAKFFVNSAELDRLDAYKNKFAELDEWSGSRFIRRDNPNANKDAKGILRSNPVTGIWSPR